MGVSVRSFLARAKTAEVEHGAMRSGVASWRPDVLVLSARRYRVLRDWSYYDVELDVTLEVEAGFECDGASAPRPYNPLDFSVSAFVAHDWLYARRGRVSPLRTLTREECDGVFYRLMRREGVNAVRAWLAYRAVRLFGGVAWRNHE